MFRMSSYGAKADMETPVPLVNSIVNYALFHSSPHISQTLLQNVHIMYLCLADSLLNYAADFVVT